MRKLFEIILLILSVQQGVSQETKFLDKEILLGGIVPTGSEISKIYNQGLSSEFRLSKNIGNLVCIKPFFNYSFFANYPNSYQLENIHFLTLGLNADIIVKINSKLSFYSGPSVCAIHYFDYLDWADKNILNYNSDNIVLFGNLFSYDLRIGLNCKQFIIELNYRPLESEPKFKNAFKSLDTDRLYQLYKINYRPFNLSMFSVNLGIKL